MTLPVTSTGSPFDAIKQIRADGTEYWSARDLMGLMAYDQWRNFEAAIQRARVTAQNQGHRVSDHFADASKKVGIGSGAAREVSDQHLTRFAAYLTVMNGDPRKPEIAAAQAYFAIKTREAEVQAIMARELPATFAEALRLAADQAERIEAANAKIQADAPLVEQAQTFRLADGLRTIPDLANDLQVHAASNYPGLKVRHQAVFDLAGRLVLIIRGDTVRANQPTSRAISAGWVKPKETVYEDSKGRSHLKIGTRLTPRGYARLWDAAVANLREHRTVLPALREIAS